MKKKNRTFFYRTDRSKTERRSKTEPFFDRFAKFGFRTFGRKMAAVLRPTVRKPTKLGRFTNKK